MSKGKLSVAKIVKKNGNFILMLRIILLTILVMNFSILNGTTCWVDGKIGTALEFDGVDDYVNVSDNANLRFGTDDFTIEAWIQKSNTERYQTIIAKGQTAAKEWSLYQSNSSQVRFYADNGNIDLRSTENIDDGIWHHIAIVRDGDNVYLYFDGDLDKTQTGKNNIDLSTIKNITIGASAQGNAWLWTGKIDEIRIYSKALSAEEIEEHYIE